MFGTNDDAQTTMGAPTVQNPSMLDNVSPQDFQTPQDPQTTQAVQPTPVVEHPLTTDNPFVGDPTTVSATDSQAVATVTPSYDGPQISSVSTPTTTTFSPSGPVQPPVVEEPQETVAQTSTIPVDDAQASSEGGLAVTPIDHDKLAEMKRDALEHLAPLADQIDGTPEETFRTTMMMIQANDNHLLLEKALSAAKKIEDDKTRAQAMLDIINEINYFSQAGQ